MAAIRKTKDSPNNLETNEDRGSLLSQKYLF